MPLVARHTASATGVLRLHLSCALRATNSAQDDKVELVGRGLGGVWGRGGWGGFVVFEDAGDFAEETFFLLRVGVGVLGVG